MHTDPVKNLRSSVESPRNEGLSEVWCHLSYALTAFAIAAGVAFTVCALVGA